MKIEKFFHPDGDRYAFDFNLCKSSDGWAQIDTEQDAWYFGIWANPFKLKVVEYAEGDVSIMTHNDEKEFSKQIRDLKESNGERFGIDPGFNQPLKEKFFSIGLGDLIR